jgi:cation diffusion facilitator CzcD-associated flavoprotein CzcO
MASGHEIIAYIRDVKRKFQLDRWIQFNAAVEQAIWNEDSGKWQLRSTLLASGCDDALVLTHVQLRPRMVLSMTNVIS